MITKYVFNLLLFLSVGNQSFSIFIPVNKKPTLDEGNSPVSHHIEAALV